MSILTFSPPGIYHLKLRAGKREATSVPIHLINPISAVWIASQPKGLEHGSVGGVSGSYQGGYFYRHDQNKWNINDDDRVQMQFTISPNRNTSVSFLTPRPMCALLIPNPAICSSQPYRLADFQLLDIICPNIFEIFWMDLWDVVWSDGCRWTFLWVVSIAPTSHLAG